MKMKIKIRKTWQFDPSERIHSTKKGKKGYNRSESKRAERNYESE